MLFGIIKNPFKEFFKKNNDAKVRQMNLVEFNERLQKAFQIEWEKPAEAIQSYIDLLNSGLYVENQSYFLLAQRLCNCLQRNNQAGKALYYAHTARYYTNGDFSIFFNEYQESVWPVVKNNLSLYREIIKIIVVSKKEDQISQIFDRYGFVKCAVIQNMSVFMELLTMETINAYKMIILSTERFTENQSIIAKYIQIENNYPTIIPFVYGTYEELKELDLVKNKIRNFIISDNELSLTSTLAMMLESPINVFNKQDSPV